MKPYTLGSFFEAATSTVFGQCDAHRPVVQSTASSTYLCNKDFLPSFVAVQNFPTAAVIFALPARTEARELLDQFKTLEENWDGYGALKISEEAYNTASMFIKNLPPTITSPEISPNPNGTITLEWETNTSSAQLEVGRTTYSFFLRPTQGKKTYMQGAASEVPPVIGLLATLQKPTTSTPPTSEIKV